MTTKITLALSALCGLTLALTPTSADAEYRDLCDSAQVCEYTGPNAPALDLDVCLDATGEVRIKGSTACVSGSFPFHARFGEVYDPIQGLVVAYVPLESACAVPGICEQMPDGYSEGSTTAQNICCIGAICWPGSDCGGTLMWCDDGVSNEDGTVTCFESWEPPQD